MNVVDSSAWLEYFADGPNADAFSQAVEAVDQLIVPTICLYEVFKSVLRQRGQSAAFSAIALMRQGQVIPLTERIALLAADLSLQTRLPMADSVILATARVHRAHTWTQDADFDGLDEVTFVAKE